MFLICCFWYAKIGVDTKILVSNDILELSLAYDELSLAFSKYSFNFNIKNNFDISELIKSKKPDT